MDHSSSLPMLSYCGEFVVKPNLIVGPRIRPDYELVYFPVGTQTECRVIDQTFLLDKPCFVVTQPHHEHFYHFDAIQPIRHLFFHFNWPLKKPAEHDIVATLNMHPMIIVQETMIVPQILRHILLLSHSEAFNHHERCRQLLFTALQEIANSIIEGMHTVEQIPAQVIAAKKYIKKHLHRSSLTIVEIARHAGWSHEHLTRQFVKHIGMQPREEIIRQRIDSACQLLLQETWSIKQIAFSLGYEDEHYFSRTFKKLKGMTASAYREKYMNPAYLHLAMTEELSTAYPLNHYIGLA